MEWCVARSHAVPYETCAMCLQHTCCNGLHVVKSKRLPKVTVWDLIQQRRDAGEGGKLEDAKHG